jgi:hypothetical protein
MRRAQQSRNGSETEPSKRPTSVSVKQSRRKIFERGKGSKANTRKLRSEKYAFIRDSMKRLARRRATGTLPNELVELYYFGGIKRQPLLRWRELISG